nr:FAD-dependent oxidoreductase [Gemmatimonadaceae bacterium]
MTTTAATVDAACIGTGQAVPALATALARRGESVIVIERGLVGGSCVNVGCTPTKTLRKSARVAHMARRAAEFGVVTGPVQIDFAAVMARVQGIVDASRTGLTGWMTSTPGVELIRARAHFDGRDGDRSIVVAGDRRFSAAKVYVNTGTRPALPPVPGLAESAPLTNETILALRETPAHLVIIGGSYIGLEFAQIFRRLGSEVTVLEHSPRIASREEPD